MAPHTRSHAPLFGQAGPAVTQVQQKVKLKPTEKKRPWGTVPRGLAESMERVPVGKPADKAARGSPSSEDCGKATAPAGSSSAADDDDEGSFEEDAADETLVPARDGLSAGSSQRRPWSQKVQPSPSKNL